MSMVEKQLISRQLKELCFPNNSGKEMVGKELGYSRDTDGRTKVQPRIGEIGANDRHQTNVSQTDDEQTKDVQLSLFRM